MYYTVFCWDESHNCYRTIKGADRISREQACRIRDSLALLDRDVEVIAW